MSTVTVSPLRQRMIEDMSARKLGAHSQRSHIYSCKRFAAFAKRSLDTATPDDIRRFQLHLAETGMSICNRNRIMTGVKFLLRVTLRRRATARLPGRGGFLPMQSRGHSAHIGQDVVIHYRWHPLYGRSARRIQRERRASADVVHVELSPGAVTKLPRIRHDKEAYKGRNVIERCFCRLKDWRRIATRYDKLAQNFLSALCFVAMLAYWL